MGLLHCLTQAGGAHVRVDLRGLKRRMPQEVLDLPQVCPTFDEVSGCAVAEPVRRQMFLKPSSSCSCINDVTHGSIPETPSAYSQKDGVACLWAPYVDKGASFV